MEAEKAVGLADYIAAFRRRRVLMISIAAPLIIIAGVAAVALPSVYTSAAAFHLLATTSAEANRQSYADQVITGLSQYVLSDAKKLDIVQKVKPYPKLDDDSAAGRLGEDVHVKMVTGTILDPDTGHDKIINTGFEVSYDNANPAIAGKVAVMLAEAYAQGSRELALQAVSSQVKFFGDEADRVRSQMAVLESKVADFKKLNFDQLPESAQINLNVRNQTDQEQAGVEREISAQQQNRIFLLQQLQTAQAAGTGANLAQLEEQYKRNKATYDESHPDMVALRRQIESARRGGGVAITDGSLKAELETQKGILAEARLRYSDDHPDIKRLLSNIKAIDARIAAGEKTDPNAVSDTAVVVQLKTQLHAIDTELASLQNRRLELRSKYANLENRLEATPRVEKDYEALNRDLGTARAQYQQLLNQRSEAELKVAAITGGTADKFELLAAPGVPGEPSRPARGRIAMLGAIGALVLAFIAAMAAEAMDGSVRGSRDVFAALAALPLASIPEIRNNAFRQRRMGQLTAFASGTLIGIPLIYFLIRVVAR
jgi:polysaccharide biosynthesis transport protein